MYFIPILLPIKAAVHILYSYLHFLSTTNLDFIILFVSSSKYFEFSLVISCLLKHFLRTTFKCSLFKHFVCYGWLSTKSSTFWDSVLLDQNDHNNWARRWAAEWFNSPTSIYLLFKPEKNHGLNHQFGLKWQSSYLPFTKDWETTITHLDTTYSYGHGEQPV